MKRSLLFLMSAVAMLAWLPVAVADDAEPNQRAAARLIETTVTVRSQKLRASETQQVDAKSPAASPAAGSNTAGAPPVNAPIGANAATGTNTGIGTNTDDGVTVCSGVSVGRGLVVTFSHPAARQQPQSIRYRVTLPDGEQTKGTAVVVDHYSGLSLLEIEVVTLPVVELSETLPPVGATVLTAAGAGIERPLVSVGIISGSDRSLGGTDLPPLVQCDVLTSEASTGAAIVDRSGKLIGIIVAATQSGQRGGWTFAVPARHVKRLLDAHRAGQLVVLERRRPMLGLGLGAGAKEGTVVIDRVTPGGPGDQVGIKQGDLLLEAQGRKIRSAYQAVDIVLSRQPGESIELVVEQAGQRKTFQVTLGGAAGPTPGRAAAGANAEQTPMQQYLNVRRIGPNQIEVRNGSYVGEVGVNNNAVPAGEPPARSTGDEVGMLKIQLGAFEKVIAGLKEELRRREELAAETEKTIGRMQREMLELRREQGLQPQPAKPANP